MQTHYAILICFILLLLVCGCVIEKKEFSTEIIPTEPDKEIFVTLNERINTTPDNADLWYAKAELLSQQGDIPGSLDAITRAAQLSPRNSTILLKKAAILIKAGERERANREILNVLDILPGNKSALDLLASLRINTSTPLSFIQVEHDLLIEPNNTWSAFNKGRLLFEERKYRDAVAWFTKAATYDPANAAAWYLMGAAYNELENYPNAMVALKRSRELDPANPGTYYEMGRASEKLGNQTAARLYYETAVKINPDNAWTRYAYGKILATSGAYEPAINELAISLASSPCQASAWYELAMAYYRTGSYDHALDAINKAITIEPYTKEYKELYLQIRAAQDPASWSLTNVTKQLAKEPTNASLWFYQGAIAYHDGRYTDALSSLDKAVSYDPLHAQAWYYRGMSQYELGLYQEALCSFDKAIILDPANAWAYYYRGDILHKSGLCEYAIAYLNRGIQLDPSIPWTYYIKGNCYLNQSRYQLAADNFDRSLEQFPCNRWAWFFGGQSYYELGRFSTAYEYFSKALSFDPANEDFKKWKARASAESFYPDEAIFYYNQTPAFSSDTCPTR